MREDKDVNHTAIMPIAPACNTIIITAILSHSLGFYNASYKPTISCLQEHEIVTWKRRIPH